MESTTNQSNASKESEMGSDQDTAECCKEVDIVTRVGEIDEMVENSTGRTLIEYEGPANCDPYVGMEFESEEATKMFYNEYGRSVGFTIRVNTTRRSRRDGTIIGREFVCSKEGFRRKKYQSNRPHTREGCKAMIKVKKGESGKWVVTKFVKDHNHVLGTSRKVSVLRSSRHASDATKNPTITFDGARIAPPRIMSALIEQSGGSNSIGFALQECTNFTQSVQKRTLQREAQMGALPLHGLSDTVVGVLGRGQLGRMFCHAASCMGIKVLTLNPLKNCTSSEVSSNHMVGSFDDGDSVQEFAKKCGVLTVETEHVNVATLERLEQHGVDCQPKASTIRLTQDKYLQKFHFSQYPIPVPSFMQIDNLQSAEKAGELFGFPLMVKRRRFTHNGRRNAVAYSKGELPSAVSALGGYEQGLYAEKFAPFVKELAVLVARGRDNSVVCFPVVETIQKDNVCHIIEAPADVPEKIRKLAVDVAQRTVSSLEGAGIFAVELFLMRDDQILLNEVAPRPHNSGHHTIESCYTSQYEQHLRAITGLPLGDPSMKTSAAVMYNLLGEEGKEGFHLAHQLMKRALSIPGATVHWYEKPEMGKRRKLSHITIVGPSRSIVKARLDLMLNSENVAADTTVLPRVAIIMSSDSNLPVMKVAGEILKTFDVPFEISIVSAHQTPERMFSFASCAQERGIQVIIAADGGAAHLPGMVASLTPVPVIGVPIRASLLDGVDALLSIVQMPKGIPVATVSIGNATNAALLAIRILAVADSDLQRRMIQYQADMKETLLRKVEKLDREGWEKYSDS